MERKREWRKLGKKALAVLIALCMVLSLVPVAAMAAPLEPLVAANDVLFREQRAPSLWFYGIGATHRPIEGSSHGHHMEGATSPQLSYPPGSVRPRFVVEASCMATEIVIDISRLIGDNRDNAIVRIDGDGVPYVAGANHFGLFNVYGPDDGWAPGHMPAYIIVGVPAPGNTRILNFQVGGVRPFSVEISVAECDPCPECENCLVCEECPICDLCDEVSCTCDCCPECFLCPTCDTIICEEAGCDNYDACDCCEDCDRCPTCDTITCDDNTCPNFEACDCCDDCNRCPTCDTITCTDNTCGNYDACDCCPECFACPTCGTIICEFDGCDNYNAERCDCCPECVQCPDGCVTCDDPECSNYDNCDCDDNGNDNGGTGPRPPVGPGTSLVRFLWNYDRDGNPIYYQRNITRGGRITPLPAPPAKEGYTFMGWYLEPDTENRKNFANAVHGTYLRLYARWEPIDADAALFHKWFMQGIPEGTFLPLNNISRSEVAAMLARTMIPGFTPELTPPAGMPFPDVLAEDWFHGYVSWVHAYSFFFGFDDGTFGPLQPISRQELAATIVRASGVPIQTAGALPFSDAGEISDWARDYVYTAFRQGWMIGNGSEDNPLIEPLRPISRVETAAVFYRVLGRGATNMASIEGIWDDLRIFPDVSNENAWYFFYVVEASHSHYFTRTDGVETWTAVTWPPVDDEADEGDEEDDEEDDVA